MAPPSDDPVDKDIMNLIARQESRGGWPLGYITATCPADAPVGCQATRYFSNLNCCPEGHFCFGSLQPYCCPTEDDCATAVNNIPRCANGEWTMYRNTRDGDYFCCPSGYIGVLPKSGSGGICELEGVSIPTSQIASVASQAGFVAPTATSNSGANPVSTDGSASGNNNNSSTVSIPAGAIIGFVIGGVAIVVLIALVLWLHRRSLRKNPPGQPAPVVQTTVYSQGGAGRDQYTNVSSNPNTGAVNSSSQGVAEEPKPVTGFDSSQQPQQQLLLGYGTEIVPQQQGLPAAVEYTWAPAVPTGPQELPENVRIIEMDGAPTPPLGGQGPRSY
ncbi:hypothetical protein VTJ04DRAFT_2711 [Mycothermus thermophilus]|uniref:uncharacterized protein n=1 Tax=Humicola insolens TaxID=85995 RepID=UPI0037446F92